MGWLRRLFGRGYAEGGQLPTSDERYAEETPYLIAKGTGGELWSEDPLPPLKTACDVLGCRQPCPSTEAHDLWRKL